MTALPMSATLGLGTLLATAPVAAPDEVPDAGGSVWPLVSLVFFVTLFALMIAWLLLSRKERWARDASIPLSEEPVEPRDPGTTRNPEVPR